MRVQAAFWVVDAVPQLLFWCGVTKAVEMRHLTVRLWEIATPPHPPWVLQFELWRHWFGHGGSWMKRSAGMADNFTSLLLAQKISLNG